MIETQNSQNPNLFFLETLDLDFNKAKKTKSKGQNGAITDRANKNIPQHIDALKTDRSALIEKKKSYANAIRERNCNILAKKKKSDVGINQTINEIKASNSILEIKQNLVTEFAKERKEPTMNKKRNSKSTHNLLEKKKSLASISALNVDPIPVIDVAEQYETIINKKIQQLFTPTVTHSPAFGSKKQKLELCSNQYSQTIVVFDSDMTILKKQNTTFKRDLANFRKENSQLRKQLQDSKNIIAEMEEKAKNILEGSLVSSLVSSMNVPSAHIIDANAQNYSQIIQNLRGQIMQLRKINGGLELKAYMAQKRVVQELAVYKKKMAKQLGEWRQKCSKLRAQNIRFKSHRDMTISMNISKDQQ